jgi:membrane protease YdiL (CAAX protease family)
MHYVDHIFIFLLVAVYPPLSAWSYRREVQRIEAGKPANRLSIYASTAIIEWLALAVLLFAWFWLERPLGELGFTTPAGAGFYIGIVLVLLVSAGLVLQWGKVERLTCAERQEQRALLGKLVHFLPHTRREARALYGLSLTAGVVEEIVYRGFLIWYLVFYVPMWSAVLISSISFGLAHSYQGASGAFRCGLLGLAFAGLYLLTGSIWAPIIGHFLLDALQVPAMQRLLRDEQEVRSDSPLPA